MGIIVLKGAFLNKYIFTQGDFCSCETQGKNGEKPICFNLRPYILFFLYSERWRKKLPHFALNKYLQIAVSGLPLFKYYLFVEIFWSTFYFRTPQPIHITSCKTWCSFILRANKGGLEKATLIKFKTNVAV